MESINKKITRREFLIKGAIGGVALASGMSVAPAILRAQKAAVKIGIWLPFSGVYGKIGNDMTQAHELYFEQVGWTAGGRKIEIIKEDTEVKPPVGLRKLRKLIESDNVDFVSGPVSSAVAAAGRDLVHQTKTILLISNAGDHQLTAERCSPYIFRTSFANAQVNYPMGPWIYKNVGKTAYIMGADYTAGKEQVGGFVETFKPVGGKIIGEDWPPLGNADYGPYLAKLRRAKPEVCYVFFAGADAVNFVKQYAQYGLKNEIPLGGPGYLVDEDQFPAQGDAAIGIYSGLHYALELDNPENKKFVRDFKAKFGHNPTNYAVQGYDTARVIVEVLNKTGGDTKNKEKIIEIIRAIKFNSPRGPFRFDPTTHNPIQNVYIRRVVKEDGVLKNKVLETVKDVRFPGKCPNI